jgi:trk system potassium uptake protein TrkA
MDKLSVAVIGLGKFGLAFGQTLMELEQNVLGIDADMDRVRHCQDILPQVYQADAMDMSALEQMGIPEVSHVMVSLGESIEASCIVSLHLKELEIPNVWVKAVSDDHEKLLKKIGVDEVVFPERYTAKQMANRMAMPGLVENLPFGQEMAIVEIPIDEWAGKTLRQLDLTNQHEVQVLAIKKTGEMSFTFIPKADDALRKGDVLVVLGQRETVGELGS